MIFRSKPIALVSLAKSEVSTPHFGRYSLPSGNENLTFFLYFILDTIANNYNLDSGLVNSAYPLGDCINNKAFFKLTIARRQDNVLPS